MWARIRGILFGNLGLKLASVLLALLLYGHVVTDQEREETVPIPVRLSGLADSLATSGELPQRVNVRVRGKWRDLIRLSLTQRGLPVDLAEVPPGQFRATITTEDVQRRAIPAELAKAVIVAEVLDPRTIDIRVESRTAKRVRVAPRVVGTPAPGYRRDGEARATPDSATVRGPASVVAGIDSLPTLAVDITGERARIQRQVDLVLEPGGLEIEPRRCLVTVPLAREGTPEGGGR
jgi:hypothetical protein